MTGTGRERGTGGASGGDPLGPGGWDGESPDPPAHEARWDQVLGLLPDIDARRVAPPDPPREPRYSADGVLIVDFSGASSPVASSLGYFAQTDLTESGFDWGGFVGSPRGRLLAERVAAGEAGDMTLDECRMFLVALARQERFFSGAVDGAIRSGFVGVVLRKAEELVRAEAAGRA